MPSPQSPTAPLVAGTVAAIAAASAAPSSQAAATATATATTDASNAKSSTWIELLSGSAAGFTSVTVGYPFDTLKVKMQTANSQSTVQLAKDIVRKEGFRGFFAGLLSPLIGVSAINAVLFFTFNKSLDVLHAEPSEERKSLRNVFYASIVAGAALVLVECPVELIKAKMQAKAFSPSYLASLGARAHQPSTISLAAHILKEQRYNPRYLFQGFTATAGRNIPANIAYLVTYEWLQKWHRDRGTSSFFNTLLNGGFAGVMYWSVSFPFDTIKSQMQTDATRLQDRRFHNTWQCARAVYSGQYDAVPRVSWTNFYKGFTPCLIRSFPANATCFLTYEFVKGLLVGVGGGKSE